jgi:hypothetical protein
LNRHGPTTWTCTARHGPGVTTSSRSSARSGVIGWPTRSARSTSSRPPSLDSYVADETGDFDWARARRGEHRSLPDQTRIGLELLDHRFGDDTVRLHHRVG